MGTYLLTYISDVQGQPDVHVALEETNDGGHIVPVIKAFQQLLLGVTYQPGSLAKYFNQPEIDGV